MSSNLVRTLGLATLAGIVLAALSLGVLMPSLNASGGASKTSGLSDDAPLPARRRPGEPVKAAETARSPGGALSAAGRLPSSLDLVLVIERGEELRASRLGAAASRFFADATGLGESRAAWSALSAKLGWTDSELFDRLLGRRAVLAARAASDGKSMLWVLLSDITLETDARLKERLEASQRSIDQGHQVLSIEKGRYELTSHRHERAAPRRGGPVEGGPEITIVLGPTGQSELFDEMVSVLTSGATSPLGSTPAMKALLDADEKDAPRDPEVLLLTRLRGRQSTGPNAGARVEPEAWSNFFAAAGERGEDLTGSRLNVSVIYREPRFEEGGQAVPLTSDAVFHSLKLDSLLTVVQAAPMRTVLGSSGSMLDFLRELPRGLPESVRGVLGARQVISIRRVVVPGSAVVRAPGPEGRASGAVEGRIAALVAMETSSTEELARTMDGAIAGFVHNTLEQGSGVVRPAPYNFAGQLPHIARVLPIRMGDGNLLRRFSPEPLALAWSYPRNEGMGSADGPAAGWWVIELAPMPREHEQIPSELQRAAVDAITGASQGDVKRWVWLASARPRELESLLPDEIQDFGGVRTAMKRFEAAELRLRVGDSGDIRGDVTFQLAD